VPVHCAETRPRRAEQTCPASILPQPPIEPDDTVISVPYTAAAVVASSVAVSQGAPFQGEPPVQPEDTLVSPLSTAPGSLESQLSESGPPAPPPAAAPASGKRSFPLRWLALLGVLVLLAIGAASAYGGYQSALSQRVAAGATQSAAQVQEQFALGMQDMEARRFDLARQRFEYVIQMDPSYPGVTEKPGVSASLPPPLPTLPCPT
jgi:hypothetical protein